MQASLTAHSLLHSSEPIDTGAIEGLQCQARADGPTLSVNSNDLLQGQKAVSIAHNGAIYRLQATRLGKLILTK